MVTWLAKALFAKFLDQVSYRSKTRLVKARSLTKMNNGFQVDTTQYILSSYITLHSYFTNNNTVPQSSVVFFFFLAAAFFLTVKSGHCCTWTPSRLELMVALTVSTWSSVSSLLLLDGVSQIITVCPIPDNILSPAGLNWDKDMICDSPGWWS